MNKNCDVSPSVIIVLLLLLTLFLYKALQFLCELLKIVDWLRILQVKLKYFLFPISVNSY